jgi:hypothetical protein
MSYQSLPPHPHPHHGVAIHHPSLYLPQRPESSAAMMRSVVKEASPSYPRRVRVPVVPHARAPAAVAAAREAADDCVEDAGDARDDGVQDVSDAVNHGREAVADGSEDALNAGHNGTHFDGSNEATVLCVVLCVCLCCTMVVVEGCQSQRRSTILPTCCFLKMVDGCLGSFVKGCSFLSWYGEFAVFVFVCLLMLNRKWKRKTFR